MQEFGDNHGFTDAFQDLSSALARDAESFGINLSDSMLAKLLKHLALVLEKNKSLNLTRITDAEEGLVLHILDSILLSPAIPSGSESFLDIGTGGGFPGIPLAIVTGMEAVLLDSSKKKILAVDDFLRELELDKQAKALSLRAEEYAKQEPESVDCVVARAVAETRVLVEYAAPLLKQSGSLIVAKADPSEEEINAGNKTAEICGMERVSRETLLLPRGYGKRTILVYKKTSEPKVTLPRRNGVAVKRPLFK